MKKLLLFLFMLVPVVASADPVEIDGIWYNLIPKAKKAEVTSGTTKYTGNVVIPEYMEYEGVTYSVTSIGVSAFEACRDLTSVDIPNIVTSIGNNAFHGCKSLTSIIIPNGVTSIGVNAFNGCSGLISITIPNSVTFLGGSSFYDCKSLTSITIPNSVTSIGSTTFSNCSSLTSITIPNSITSIGNRSFSGCSGLTSITIPNSVTSIGERSFQECSSLTSITISNNVTSIGDYAFSGCSSLTSIIIPNRLTSIGNSTFYECSSLTSITISNSVTSIGNRSFSGCSGLSFITIPNSVTSIGSSAFYGCDALETIVIGNGVKSIGSSAFANCKNLTEVTCLAQNVPSTETNAFNNSMIEYATLNVLRSANDYRNTKPWSDFGNIVSFTPVYKLTYILDGEEYKTYEYEEGESITPEPDPSKEGYFFSGWSEIPETMPAYDVIVTGSFLLKPVCAKPTITLLPNGKVKVESATEGATCVTNITATNAEPITNGEISLSKPLVVYTITSYATKEGYDDSEVATSTFRYEKKEGDINDDGNLNISDVVQLVNMILDN